MSNAKRVVIRVSTQTAALLKSFADARDLDVGQAADRLVRTASNRVKSVTKYARKAGKARK